MPQISKTDPALFSATELVAAYARKTLSPVEATAAALARIDRLDGRTNAFSLVDRDGAMRAAREAEARWAKGAPAGVADGVPTTIKDLTLTKGHPTLRGSRTIARDQPWDEDAPATARLKETGAVILGKTTTPEFGWKGVTDSPLTGITRNPWDLSRTPGGSSGGAVVAAALGMGALHIGSDGGGSIRIPASFTGVFGLKATFGRVPAYPSSPFGTVSHIGPITRTVADAALMLTVISGADARDGHALPADGRDWRIGLDRGVRGMKIGFASTLNDEPVDPGVAAIVLQGVGTLGSVGAHIEPLTLSLPDVKEVFNTHWYAGAANLLANFTPEQRALLDPGLAEVAAAGARITLLEYLAAVKRREAFTASVNALFDRFDVIVLPAMPITAIEAGREVPDGSGLKRWIDWTPFSYPFNLTRHPAASVPCGRAGGLPVGLQILGPMYREDLVLAAARAVEAMLPAELPPMAAE